MTDHKPPYIWDDSWMSVSRLRDADRRIVAEVYQFNGDWWWDRMKIGSKDQAKATVRARVS